MTNKLFKAFLTLSLLYATFIFYLSSKSDLPHIQQMGSGFIYLFISFIKQIDIIKQIGLMLYGPAYFVYHNPDKVLHTGLYFGFGIFLFFTFRYYKNTTPQRYAALFAIIAGLTYGAFDELHQYFVPGRTASMADLAADGIGLLLAQVVIIILYSMRKKINLKNQEIE